MTTDSETIGFYSQEPDHHSEQPNDHIVSLLTKIYNSAKSIQDRTNSAMQDESHVQNIYAYIERTCKNEQCKRSMRLSRCIVNCILPNSNIQLSRFNNTFFFYLYNNNLPYLNLFSSDDINEKLLPFFHQFSELKYTNENTPPSFYVCHPSYKEASSILYWFIKHCILPHNIQSFSWRPPLSTKAIALRYLCCDILYNQLHDNPNIIHHDTTDDRMISLTSSELLNLLNLFGHPPMPGIGLNILSNKLNHKKHIIDNLLFNFSNGNIHAIQDFLTLLANCTLGYNFSQKVNSNTPQLTVIHAQDVNLMHRFISTILNTLPLLAKDPNAAILLNMESQQDLTQEILPFHDFNFSQFSSSDNIFTHLQYEISGTNIFISTKNISSKTDLSFFKKMISNTGYTISNNDPVFGKIKYKSTSHYIYITDNLDNANKHLTTLSPYRLIDFSGPVPQENLDALSRSECYFIILNAIYLFITNAPVNDNAPENMSQKLNASEAFKKFIELFCVDTTNQIDPVEINLVLKEASKEFAVGADISASKYDTLRKNLATTLKITDLDYTLATDLYTGFTEWQQNSPIYVPKLTQSDFIEQIHLNYSSVFYIKHSNAKSLYESKTSQAKVMYGLKLDPTKITDFIHNKQSKIEQEQRIHAFESYWKKLENDCNKWYNPLKAIYTLQKCTINANINQKRPVVDNT